jgi:hypothetical protein
MGQDDLRCVLLNRASSNRSRYSMVRVSC